MTALAVSTPTPSVADTLRAERDRYVAFAFAAADLLLEVNENGVIVFAVGALRSLTRRDSATLVGRPSPSFEVPTPRPRSGS